jgi:predicted XRE-type DNA-binding protein
MTTKREKRLAAAQQEASRPIDPDEFETGLVIRAGENALAAMGLPDAGERHFKIQLALALKQVMKARGLTQPEVANLAGLTQPDISNITRGRLKGFSAERLMNILKVLTKGVSVHVELEGGGRLVVAV